MRFIQVSYCLGLPARGQPGDQVAEPLGAADPGRRHEHGQPEQPGGLGQPGRPQPAGIQPGSPLPPSSARNPAISAGLQGALARSRGSMILV